MNLFAEERIRFPVVAGLFYPDERITMEATLCSYGIQKGLGGNALAIIAPHGAWKLSGSIAGTAFSAAAGRIPGRSSEGISRVVLLGRIHNSGEEGVFLSDSCSFETPLGNLPVSRSLCEALASCSTGFEINDIPHLRESSLEVLLPFVKFFFPGADIVPVLMGGSNPGLISALARGLALVFKPLTGSTLFVVSANLSLNKDEALARVQAEACLNLLLRGQYGEFGPSLRAGTISPCGGALIASLLESGILDHTVATSLSGPLIKAEAELGVITYYGAVAFKRRDEA
jgi:AmmeMemoRadiSam system protein B